MKIVNARLRRQEALFTLELQDGIIRGMTAQTAMRTADTGDIDAQGRLAIPLGSIESKDSSIVH